MPSVTAAVVLIVRRGTFWLKAFPVEREKAMSEFDFPTPHPYNQIGIDEHGRRIRTIRIYLRTSENAAFFYTFARLPISQIMHLRYFYTIVGVYTFRVTNEKTGLNSIEPRSRIGVIRIRTDRNQTESNRTRFTSRIVNPIVA